MCSAYEGSPGVKKLPFEIIIKDTFDCIVQQVTYTCLIFNRIFELEAGEFHGRNVSTIDYTTKDPCVRT